MICEKREAECVCHRTTRHKIHRCDCGGSWVYDEQGRMVPRSFPGDRNLTQALDALLGPFAGLFR